MVAIPTSTPISGQSHRLLRQPEAQACLLCGGSLRHYRDLHPPYRLFACSNCGLVVTTPRMSAEHLPAHYQEAYDQELGIPFQLQLRRQEEILRQIEKHVSKGALVDIGCGRGHFLDSARSSGWRTTGLEINRIMSAYAREKFGLEVYTGGAEEMASRLGGRRFDVVYLSHVVEHLPNPVQVLEKARKFLNPAGILIVRVPNLDCLLFRLLGSHYLELYPEGHLYQFTVPTLTRLLEKSGFAVVCSFTRQCDFAHEGFLLAKGVLDALSIYERVRPSESVGECLARPQEASPANRIREWGRRLTFPFYVLTYPIWRASARLGQGYEIFAVARVRL